jgi:HopA1 effector protein family
MTPYLEQLGDALAAIRIHDRFSYSWLGRRTCVLPARLRPYVSDAELRRILHARVRESLYTSFYCHGRAMPAPLGRAQRQADPELTRSLERANAGNGGWDAGWTLERLEGDVAIASRELRVRAGPDRRRAAADGRIELRRPKGLGALSPGHYMALSDASMPDGAVVRVYWNTPPASAPRLLGALTERLNRDAIAFRMKVASHPATLARCDGAVLYVPIGQFDERTIRDLAATIPLRHHVPAFTLQAAPGVGLAEDGGDGESFGLLRCGSLAEGLLRAREHRARGHAARLRVVLDTLEESGVDPAAPYRDPRLVPHVL